MAMAFADRLVFKLAHNGLQIGGLAGLVTLNYQFTTRIL
jgi:hypothetical protein